MVLDLSALAFSVLSPGVTSEDLGACVTGNTHQWFEPFRSITRHGNGSLVRETG
jgi:hypothetical protein